MSALNNRQIARAALVVLLGFLASGALGLVRTAAFAITFGATETLDAFYAAQRIPETLYVLVAGGALGSSFIPVFARFISADDEDGAWRLASAVMTCTAAASAVLALIVMLLCPLIVPALLVPSEPPDVQALTVSLTQIMLVTVVLFSVSGLLMGILNARQAFTLPALALSANNIGQIIGALVIVPLLPAEYAVYGLAWGAVLGAAGHLLIQVPGLPRVGARLRVLLDPRVAGVRDVLLLMLPRVFGLAITQINFIVNVNLTSGMAAGSRTALVMAWTLMFFALGVIAQSIGTAVFPSLAALASANDLDGFKDRLAGALRGVLFLAFPATAALIVLGEPLVALLLQYGRWTDDSTAATAWALSFFAVGIAGHALLEVLSRAFYALGDTRTPVLVGAASMIANIALSLILIRVIGDPTRLSRGAFAGLALANSLTTLLEAGALWWLLRRRIGGGRDADVIRVAGKALAAAAVFALAAVLILTALEGLPIGTLTTLIRLGAAGGVGALVFFGLAFVLGIEEARTVPLLVLRRFRR